jgi:hypothetical protein
MLVNSCRRFGGLAAFIWNVDEDDVPVILHSLTKCRFHVTKKSTPTTEVTSDSPSNSRSCNMTSTILLHHSRDYKCYAP